MFTYCKQFVVTIIIFKNANCKSKCFNVILSVKYAILKCLVYNVLCMFNYFGFFENRIHFMMTFYSFLIQFSLL